MDCWKYEAILVGAILGATAIASGGHGADWLGAAAVLFTFMHGQISFDFQEAQGALEKPQVHCFKWSGRYFVVKEILWIATFTLLSAWPLLVGTAIFATYPWWRRRFREFMEQRRAAADSQTTLVTR